MIITKQEFLAHLKVMNFAMKDVMFMLEFIVDRAYEKQRLHDFPVTPVFILAEGNLSVHVVEEPIENYAFFSPYELFPAYDLVKHFYH